MFVADVIPRELQRIVEFLNERMSPTEVLAVELRQYAGGGLTTHIPRVIGQTAAAQEAKAPSGSGGGRTQYDRVELSDQEFLAYVEEHGRPGVRGVFADLIAWARAQPQLESWSERKGQTVFKVHLPVLDPPIFLSAYAPRPGARGSNDGRIHHNGFRSHPFPSEAGRAEFFERVSRTPGLGWTPDQAFKEASIPTAALLAPGAVEHLLDALSWGLGRVTVALGRGAPDV